MDARDFVQPGMSREAFFVVEEQYTAAHVGSGSLRVLATPSMIAFIERTARDLLQEALPEGYSSVGFHVDVRHLAPTPLGGQVRVMCAVEQVEARRVDFKVEAWDRDEQVGAGWHQRVVIDVSRFMQRVEAKQAG